MQPFQEILTPAPDSSCVLLNRRLDDAIPFIWHHHPELELTLTLNSVGQRFVGNHVGDYGDGDLVLVGANLPHTWASRGKIDAERPHVALVIWFRQDWIEALAGGSVEFRRLHDLLRSASAGLAFGAALGRALAGEIEALFRLPPPQRLLGLLGILTRLAEATDVEPLSTVTPPPSTLDRSRIDRVLDHLHRSYDRPLRLGDVADVAALSPSGLHRLFRKQTGVGVMDYVTGLRIGAACAQLSGTSAPIAVVAGNVGYGSLANFNRQFLRLRGMTPRQYRSSFRGGRPARGTRDPAPLAPP